MLFSSMTFLVAFLPITLLAYYYMSSIKARNLLLLLVSILFYSWGEPKFAILMILSIMINYKAGLLLGVSKDDILYKYRKLILVCAVVLNLGFLFYFKYFGFATEITNQALELLGLGSLPVKNIILPLGISFYTFHSLSYIIDVYREPELAQKNILNLGLYITFFPQLIAGPIVRYHDVNAQYENRIHTASKFAAGIERFGIGLAKKILIANVVGRVADGIFALPLGQIPAYYTWIAVLAYALQIYYDFSGYSDMAIGLGKMFGIDFLENFDYPYISKSITEFWRRWHISLSRWFKDYLYIPLGGNRKGNVRTYVNLLIIFFTTGLWHGASLSFIFWGLGHGFFMVIERIFGKKIKSENNRILGFLSHVYTLLVVVFLWVFFRLGMNESVTVIKNLFGFGYATLADANQKLVMNGSISLLVNAKFYTAFALGILFCAPWWRRPVAALASKVPVAYSTVKYAFIIALLVISFANIATNAYNPFIYFRF